MQSKGARTLGPDVHEWSMTDSAYFQRIRRHERADPAAKRGRKGRRKGYGSGERPSKIEGYPTQGKAAGMERGEVAKDRMRNLQESEKALRELLAERILVLDGAMGTMLQQRDLSAADFGGAALEGCNENLVVTRPDVVLDIHRKYFEAGSDIVETNSFGGTPLVLAEYGLADQAQELNRLAAVLARQAADEFSAPGRPRFVAGSMGPTTKAITVTGGVTFEGLQDSYYVQAKGLIEGGSDLLLVETCQDTRNIKAAILAIQQLSKEIGAPVPYVISVTIEPMGSMLAGQTVEAMWASLRHTHPLAFGMNCATGPEFMTDHIRTLSALTSEFVSCYPNAGLPNP